MEDVIITSIAIMAFWAAGLVQGMLQGTGVLKGMLNFAVSALSGVMIVVVAKILCS